MNIIAIFDTITFVAAFSGLIILIMYWRGVTSWEIKALMLSLLTLTMVYSATLFMEWYAGLDTFEDYENLAGALIPMMWGFFFYNIIQQASSLDLRASKTQLDLAIKGTRAGLWDWEIPTDDVKCNKRWAEIFGYKIKELAPIKMMNIKNYVHPDDLNRSVDLLRKHFNRKIDFYECEVRMKHKEGYWLWVMIRGILVKRDNKGNPLRMTGTLIDVNKFKEIENEHKQQIEENRALYEKYLAQNRDLIQSISQVTTMNSELLEAKEKAEESDRLKSAFLSNVSHEIRTPMNGIIGFSSMLKKPNLSKEKRTLYSEIIIESSKQLLSIVNDILDISRIETGKLDISRESVDIHKLIDDLYVFFNPQAEQKKIPLILFKEQEENAIIVEADKVRLKQVLSNLLHNALKFTNEGHVEFGYHLMNDWLQFFVKDTGMGIDKKYHEEIFKPFRQVETDVTRVPGGAGLGLSISKKLVEAMGGTINLESHLGRGSTFLFTLPVNRISKLNTTGKFMIHEKENDQIQNMSILIAEDDDVNYLYLKELLGGDSAKLIRAHNGVEAVEYSKSKMSIHLVLMDVKMPLLNGYDATKQIKKLRPTLPIIAVTAYAKDADRRSALKAGCNDYISKPIKKEELFACIKKYSHA